MEEYTIDNYENANKERVRCWIIEHSSTLKGLGLSLKDIDLILSSLQPKENILQLPQQPIDNTKTGYSVSTLYTATSMCETPSECISPTPDEIGG